MTHICINLRAIHLLERYFECNVQKVLHQIPRTGMAFVYDSRICIFVYQKRYITSSLLGIPRRRTQQNWGCKGAPARVSASFWWKDSMLWHLNKIVAILRMTYPYALPLRILCYEFNWNVSLSVQLTLVVAMAWRRPYGHPLSKPSNQSFHAKTFRSLASWVGSRICTRCPQQFTFESFKRRAPNGPFMGVDRTSLTINML